MDDKQAGLTDRQQKIAGLVTEGLTNRQIAQELNRSPYTVRNEVIIILRKLNVKNRVQLATRIIEQRPNNQPG